MAFWFLGWQGSLISLLCGRDSCFQALLASASQTSSSSRSSSPSSSLFSSLSSSLRVCIPDHWTNQPPPSFPLHQAPPLVQWLISERWVATQRGSGLPPWSNSRVLGVILNYDCQSEIWLFSGCRHASSHEGIASWQTSYKLQNSTSLRCTSVYNLLSELSNAAPYGELIRSWAGSFPLGRGEKGEEGRGGREWKPERGKEKDGILGHIVKS